MRFANDRCLIPASVLAVFIASRMVTDTNVCNHSVNAIIVVLRAFCRSVYFFPNSGISFPVFILFFPHDGEVCYSTELGIVIHPIRIQSEALGIAADQRKIIVRVKLIDRS